MRVRVAKRRCRDDTCYTENSGARTSVGRDPKAAAVCSELEYWIPGTKLVVPVK